MQQGHGHQPFRDEAGALRRLTGEARILEHVLDHERLAAHEDEPRDPGARREPAPDQRLRALARDGLEDQLVALLVEEEDGRGLGMEDPARNLDDRLQQLAVIPLGAEDPRRDGAAELLAHESPATFDAVR